MRTAVFDLDGTLADTSADLIAAANACFRAMGAGDVLDPVTDAATAFLGGRAMLRLGLSRRALSAADAEIDLWYPRLLEEYGAALNTHTLLYPGAERAIETLLSADWRLSICTNKPERLAETLMQRLGLRAPFGALIGADTLPVRKPDPLPYTEAVRRAGGDPARSFLLGDTITDRDTARAARVPVALVTFGPTGREVAALSPDALLDHYDDLNDLAGRLVVA